ncbi:FAD:protein FMN transferase [uncultured Bacteroides sp.]|uniref:FAD:protein FMN transferase n=1 Tax=uncultured Bacteroides sp. TaxID=162156 RepID=UPI002AABF2DB|nr:FAD:protein FMN transferase [uncultured Bacteroides sp.]
MKNDTIQHLTKSMSNGSQLLYSWFTSMHTRVDILLYRQDENNIQLEIANLIYNELKRLEQLANFYDDSELSRINTEAAKHPVTVSPELFEILSFCLSAHKRTFGCFDIAIHSDNYNKETIHAISMSAEDRTISFSRPGVRINLSGCLKGYALERVRSILNNNGQENALINLGNSSVLALGNHPYGEGWKVGFGNGMTCNSGEREVWLFNECLTTSGNDSEERKHIIDPCNGKPVEGHRQVAVATNSGMEGEILSTALFVALIDQREELLKSFSPRWVQHLFVNKYISRGKNTYV